MKGKIIKFRKKRKINKKMLLVIVALAFLYNIFNNYVFAKYSTGFVINTSAEIAKPIVEIEGEKTKEITASLPKTSYIFSVKNYNELEEINEVSMEYYIEIISEKIEFLDIHLYKEDKEIKLMDYKTEKMGLKIEEKQEDKYHLEVEVLEDIEESLLENLQTNLEIKIISVQTDK